MMYAREMQQGSFSTASRRDQFRAISRRWHRFWGLGLEDDENSSGVRKRKAEPFDSMREEARYRRFSRLQQVHMAGQFRQMMNKDVRFRGNQEAVIRAIVRGESPIVQIAGTGCGKGTSFMLPAFCSPEGVTIVVVPMVALRQDLHGKCKEYGIDSHVWDGRGGNRAASIVFVTPESAVTKAFSTFVMRLCGRQQLDRIVVDECHTILDSEWGFRPQMRKIGEAIRRFGVQAVFLTATLALEDQEEFLRRMQLVPAQVRWFRMRTTRKNIKYWVNDVYSIEDEEAAACEMVWAGLEAYESGRIIVYSSDKKRIDRLARELACPAYYSDVDTAEGKERRMAQWKEARVIVATNALGLGIDVPDVRLVVHAGASRRLRDFAQESGRAGRDGAASRSIIVRCPSVEQRTEGPEQDRGMQAFLSGKRCRRTALDSVMDGWMDRVGCEEDEQTCDVCKENRRGISVDTEDVEAMDMDDEAGSRADAADGEEQNEGEREDDPVVVNEDEAVIRARYMAARGRATRLVQQEQQDRRDEAIEVAQFQEHLASWAGCCVVCRLGNEPGWYHTMDECPGQHGDMWSRVQQQIQTTEREMFTKRRLARYCVCFHCGVPQAICTRWEAIDDDGGRFRDIRGGSCQYKGVLTQVFSGFLVWFGDRAEEQIRGLMRADGADGGRQQEWFP